MVTRLAPNLGSFTLGSMSTVLAVVLCYIWFVKNRKNNKQTLKTNKQINKQTQTLKQANKVFTKMCNIVIIHLTRAERPCCKGKI